VEDQTFLKKGAPPKGDPTYERANTVGYFDILVSDFEILLPPLKESRFGRWGPDLRRKPSKLLLPTARIMINSVFMMF
jgi:hypothetical protein